MRRDETIRKRIAVTYLSSRRKLLKESKVESVKNGDNCKDETRRLRSMTFGLESLVYASTAGEKTSGWETRNRRITKTNDNRRLTLIRGNLCPRTWFAPSTNARPASREGVGVITESNLR